MTDRAADPEEIARRWVDEVWNQTDADRRREAVGALHSASFLNEGHPSTPDDVLAWHAAMRTTYPDLHYTIDELVSAGDRVTFRWTARGTQLGELWAMLPPSGRAVEWNGIHLVTVRDARIVEVWGASNTVAVLQQLGVQIAPRLA